jgi:hypothetical protein
MKVLNHKIRIISKNEKELIHPSELLLPLNSLVNLINFLENVEDEYKKYESSPRVNKDQSDFQRFIEFRLQYSRHRIKSIGDNNCVTIKAMSKKSPYWVDLVITASPYVIQMLNLLIDHNQEELNRRLAIILDRTGLFDESKNQLIVKKIIRNLQLITKIVSITIENYNRFEK